MTMHLLGPQYSLINTKKQRPKLTKTKIKQLEKELREHNKWLKQQHQPPITFDQYVDISYGTGEETESRRVKAGRSYKMKTYTPTHSYNRMRTKELSNYRSVMSDNHSVHVTSIMDPRKLSQESEEVRNEIIAKSKRITVAYNKGGYQYITDGTDLKSVGRKNVS